MLHYFSPLGFSCRKLSLLPCPQNCGGYCRNLWGGKIELLLFLFNFFFLTASFMVIVSSVWNLRLVACRVEGAVSAPWGSPKTFPELWMIIASQNSILHTALPQKTVPVSVLAPQLVKFYLNSTKVSARFPKLLFNFWIMYIVMLQCFTALCNQFFLWQNCWLVVHFSKNHNLNFS